MDDGGDDEPLVLPPLAATNGSFKDQVVLPVDQFRTVSHGLGFLSVLEYHHLTREVVRDLLPLESHQLHYRSPYRQQKLVNAAVDLHEVLVDTCSSGCVAFMAGRAAMSACDVYKQSRYKPSSSIPRRQVTYWPLIPWLESMWADPVLGADIPAGMAHARQRASQPISSDEDWHDGSNCRNAVQNELFCSDTDVASHSGVRDYSKYVLQNGSISEDNEKYSRSPFQQNGDIAFNPISRTSLRFLLRNKIVAFHQELMNRSANSVGESLGRMLTRMIGAHSRNRSENRSQILRDGNMGH